MAATGSCNAIGNEIESFSAMMPARSASTNTTPASDNFCLAAVATVLTLSSNPVQKLAGIPIFNPLSAFAVGAVVPVITASSSAKSATVRAMGPSVSRVVLIGSASFTVSA